MSHYYAEELVSQLTAKAIESGESLLQIFRLAESEQDHVRLLAEKIGYTPGDVIIDAGCGTGSLARHLRAIEPTLDIKLLNISAAQLAYADECFEKRVGDIEAMPYPDGCADGVIFSYVLGHVDLRKALAEAHRVLKPGGWMFVYDVGARGPLTQESTELRYAIRDHRDIIESSRVAGFNCTLTTAGPRDFVSRIVRESFPGNKFDRVFQNVEPICLRFERRTKITTALQFSGGKDSIACLHLWRDKLEETMVMWCNSGAAYPETIEYMERIREQVPHFMEVRGNQPAVIREYGYPSDVVPVLSATHPALVHDRAGPLIQSFIDCCGRSIWAPLHQATIRLGVSRIVRGQRNSERLTGPAKHGDIIDGIEYVLPLQDWSEAEVFAYLKSVGAEVPSYYNKEPTSRDCWSCTAFRFESRERVNNLPSPRREVVLARIDHIRAAIAQAGY
jgi:ubiquinone/menaquinone biosynthesis C-methylase UbiE/3'-phosphoadenosine 5'-phosphosulfate sulfotransferase (PAPS reductase)/FAD synthetase